ncbi:MAG: hypothetical protein A2Y12_14785 [Planctomycetes bacterium GWF2_42_9]|nr:MAG: hypothetical protein A2Y12_14785 [Planctomycetes bacterium GWF2_42_9]
METNELGVRIRHCRKKAGLGIRELARIAEMSPAAISAIERQKSSPTLATLQRILSALDTNFMDFFSSDQEAGSAPVFASEAMQKISDGNRTYVLVFQRKHDIKFEIIMETIFSTKKQIAWEVHDFDVGGVMLSGRRACLEVEGLGEWLLAQDDSFYIPANQKHRLTNLDESPIRLITVYYPARQQ